MEVTGNATGNEEQLSTNPEWQRLVELANRNADILNDDDDDMIEDDDDDNDGGVQGGNKSKQSNILTLWGNVKTMNLNNVILQNILASAYFKNYLISLKTYHEIVDEIYSQVSHLEPWERGSRRTSGQVGMCGGVRGVGAGGVVSSAFCLLFKLFTLHLTRKQLLGLIRNRDSVYIRGLGFIYARYCLPPQDLWEWYQPYIDDEEVVDVKAGGGHEITVGEMLRHFLTKLDWYSTLFPRIPIPVQKRILEQLEEHDKGNGHQNFYEYDQPEEDADEVGETQPTAKVKTDHDKQAERAREKEAASYGQMLTKELERHNRLTPDKNERRRSRSRSRERRKRRDDIERRRGKERSRSRDRHRSRSGSRSRRYNKRSRTRSRSRHRVRSRSASRHRGRDREYDESRRNRGDTERESRRFSYENPLSRLEKKDNTYKREDLPELTEPDFFQNDEDDDYGRVERLLRRAAARKAAVAKGTQDDYDDDDDDGLLGIATSSSIRRGGRPSVFI